MSKNVKSIPRLHRIRALCNKHVIYFSISYGKHLYCFQLLQTPVLRTSAKMLCYAYLFLKLFINMSNTPGRVQLITLAQWFLTGGTRTTWGYEEPKLGVRSTKVFRDTRSGNLNQILLNIHRDSL